MLLPVRDRRQGRALGNCRGGDVRHRGDGCRNGFSRRSRDLTIASALKFSQLVAGTSKSQGRRFHPRAGHHAVMSAKRTVEGVRDDELHCLATAASLQHRSEEVRQRPEAEIRPRAAADDDSRLGCQACGPRPAALQPIQLTVKVPFMPLAACGSHWYVYVPFSSVTVIVFSPTNDTSVTTSSTPGPIRWKLCISDLSSTLSVYVP